MSSYQPAVPNVQLTPGCFLMSSYQPAVSSPFKAGPQAEMRRGDISHCQPHSNYASLNLIPFTLHLSLSFQFQFYVPSQPQSIPFPPLYFFSVSNSTFSTIPPFTLRLSLSFQFPSLPSLLSLHSLSAFLFLFSFQAYLLYRHSIHSPPFSFVSVSNPTFSTITPFTLHLSLSFQFPILPSPPSLHSLSTFLFLYSPFTSLTMSAPVSLHISFLQFLFSPPFPFPLSLASLHSPFTSLQNLSWEVRHCPKKISVHIEYCI
jgi:hypothetical protein